MELTEKLAFSSSTNLKIFHLYNFFHKVLLTENKNFIEAFLSEFLEEYLKYVSRFETAGTDPGFTKSLIVQLKKLSEYFLSLNNELNFILEIERIEKQYYKLCKILEDADDESPSEHKAFFPLIEKSAYDIIFGALDSVTVIINKAADNDKFIVVPSEQEMENKIINQIHTSWQLALEHSKKYLTKVHKYHEVIISFDKRLGIYEGNSLGIALTLSFLEQLLKFYNPVYIININDKTAFTGGVNKNGNILSTGEEIIKQKVRVLFYSEIKNFVFPKCEESYAYFAFTQLQHDYPNRKLKLIPVEDFSDVLNRRDLVDIKKQKLILRASKFLRHNWITAATTVILTVLLAFMFLMDFDDNPAFIEISGNEFQVKNRNGKILWTKYLNRGMLASEYSHYLEAFCRVMDINSDGSNEVIIGSGFTQEKKVYDNAIKLYCYDKSKKLLWTYKFNDKVRAKREELEPIYSLFIIDTLSVDNQKCLFLYSNNSPSFSSAIYRIDLKTGRRLPGTLWASGHFSDALIKDINNDGRTDILAVGLDNGFEDQVIFAYTLDTLTSVRLSTDEYTIKDYPISKPILYIRIQKTDYTIYNHLRMAGIGFKSLMDFPNEKKFSFTSLLHHDQSKGQMWVKLDYNLKDIDIIIDNEFRIIRDSLVAKGILKSPYTDTEEYKQIIKKNIWYWNNGNWVKREEL